MKWPNLETIQATIVPPAGYSLKLMEASDADEFARLLSEWYPDIQVGSESRFLRPEFYQNRIFSNEPRENSDFLPILYARDGEIGGWIFLEKNNDSLTVTSPMAGIVPTHRGTGSGIAHFGPQLLEAVARIMGAEMIYYISTLRSKSVQVGAEKAGYQLVGILPAFDRDQISPGKVVRVYEAVYAKVLARGESIQAPSKDSMTPTTLALWEFLRWS